MFPLVSFHSVKDKILDTFRCSNHEILYKDLHIDRVVNSFNFFHQLVDVKKILKLYDQIENETEGDVRVRIEYSVESDFKIEMAQRQYQIAKAPVLLIPAVFGKQLSGEGLGNIKTTERSYWEKNLRTFSKDSKDQDILGMNDQDFVTETSRFNIFLFDGSQFYTPRLDSGCLRGVYREHCLMDDGILFEQKKYSLEEKNFTLPELKSFRIFVGNSVHGLLTAQIIEK